MKIQLPCPFYGLLYMAYIYNIEKKKPKRKGLSDAKAQKPRKSDPAAPYVCLTFVYVLKAVSGLACG